MSSRESNPDRLDCSVQGCDAIVRATGAARDFGESHRLDEEVLARLCIVIEELVANLYDHGGLTEQDEIQLSLAVEPGGIRVVMVDPGPPFDPWAARRKTERTERGGGAGLDLVRAWARLVSYDRVSDGNRLELILSA